MKCLWTFTVLFLSGAGGTKMDPDPGPREFWVEANERMAELEAELARIRFRSRTQEDRAQMKEMVGEMKEIFRKGSEFRLDSFKDEKLEKQLKTLLVKGVYALPVEECLTFEEMEAQVEKFEENTTVCDYLDGFSCNLHLRPDVIERLSFTRNPQESKYFWTEWRKAINFRLRPILNKYLELSNRVAVLNNFANYQDYLLRNYKSVDVKSELISIWDEIEPLYLQLHAFVRRKLAQFYGESLVSRDSPIPAYLLGDVSTENWENVYELTAPYPGRDKKNATSLMIEQGFDPERMKKVAEQFFVSLNFSRLPPETWILEKNASCRPKVFDFHRPDQIKIRYCSKVGFEDLSSLHGSVSSAQYVRERSGQPYLYQKPADLGMDEAVAKMVALSVSSFNHKKKLGLVDPDEPEEDHRSNINGLFKAALKKLVSIPSFLAKEFWRWNIFDGTIKEQELECRWQILSEKFGGVSSFTRDMNFDPGGQLSDLFSKNSFVDNFVAEIAQFQIYDYLCRISGEFVPKQNNLDDCDISNKSSAGLVLREMMRLGSSEPWTKALDVVSGRSRVNPFGLLEYFHPLRKWLEEENKRTEEFIGWKTENGNDRCPKKGSTRRKRSLEDEPVSRESGKTSEESRLHRLLRRRSRRNDPGDPQVIERERKNVKEESRGNRMTDGDSKSASEKSRRNARRSVSVRTTKTSSSNGNGKNWEKDSKRYGKDADSLETSKEKRISRRRAKKNSETDGKNRFVRKIREKVRRHRKSVPNYPFLEKDIKGNNFHADTKKDISRLLHSFGFSVENDDKEKSKELKKQLKGNGNLEESEFEEDDGKKSYSSENGIESSWTNQDKKKKSHYVKKQRNGADDDGKFVNAVPNDAPYFRNGMKTEDESNANRGSSYESVIDIDRIRGDRLFDTADEKNKMWSISDFLGGNGKFSGVNLGSAKEKENGVSLLLPNGKVVGKKEILSAIEEAAKNLQMRETHSSPLGDENIALKDRKEFKEEEGGNKSPFIIIVGQIAPEMKDRLLQGKGNGNAQPSIESLGSNERTLDWERKSVAGNAKAGDKRSGSGEKIYIVPIDVKADRPTFVKTNRFAEHDRETEEQYHDGSKCNDKKSFKRGKENPSQLFISWENNDNDNGRIVKRSKREHKKSKENVDAANGVKMLRIIPMKESVWEKLLSKNLDRAKLDEKSPRMLADGNPETAASVQSPFSALASSVLSALAPKASTQTNKNSWTQNVEETDESKIDGGGGRSSANKELKDKSQDVTIGLTNPSLRCNTCGGKKNDSKCRPPEEEGKGIFVYDCPLPRPPPCPEEFREPKDVCCKKPSECSLVNCQFKITKAKKPHERLTIAIYDRINPPEELPEPYDALAVIGEALQKIQCQTERPKARLTEEDPDYPANDDADRLKSSGQSAQMASDVTETKEIAGENPVSGNENPEEEESDDDRPNSSEDEKLQSKEKATPALDQLTVFNKDKLRPVLLELRKIDDLIKKRSQ